MDAWVTSAVVDEAVDKAIVLACSLRRVHTAKKLVALTVSPYLKAKLKKVFDLVVVLDQDICNGWDLEDYSKAQCFSLTIFNKCVYLSANTLVLKNCDEIFDKYGNFAAFGTENEDCFSVFVFTPSLSHSENLLKLMKSEKELELCGGFAQKPGFAKCINLWIQNDVPNVEKLDEEYNVRVNLGSGLPESLVPTMSIVNFGDIHPLDLTPEGDKGCGTIEKLVIQFCRRVFDEDVKPIKNSPHSGKLSHLSEVYQNEPIAIVGMAFRLPGSNNVEEFWELLDKGVDSITDVPKFRWTPEHTGLASEDRYRKARAGFLTVPVDEFDAKFFGISTKEAELLDPQQRILHEVAWEALEEAMIDPLSLQGTKSGVFVGSWMEDFKDIVRRTVDGDSFRVYMGNSIASGAARLSHFLEITGPTIATEAGSASSMVAVHLACKSLRNHETNLALACGVNLILKPFDKSAMSFVLAPDGHCKTFDEGANGYGRAEGCAVLIMKRLSDAVREENDIWGLIRGSAVTQEGVSKSLGTPTADCESLAMELALKDADVNPLAVSYVEAHGTGTPVGDPMEIAAIAKTYSKGRTEPLVIGSVKTNVGHTEAVSGITGIIKVLLAMKNEKIPKHLNFERLNPAINLDVIPAKLPLEAMPWRKLSNAPRIAGVCSLGITGTDGHLILQEPLVISLPQIHEDDERPLHILKISAKSPESFTELLDTYEDMFSKKENDDGFADLAYSANTGRATFNHRAVITAKDFKEAKNILQNKSFKQAEVPSTSGSLCFLFTGQGSQYPKMAETLFNTSLVFRHEFNKCDQFLTTRYGINLKQAMWEMSEHGNDKLTRTLYSQTSIFCVEYCLLKLWESWGVKPDYVMGHSLGEFAAAVAAGVLDFEDALMLVAERSSLIDSLPCGKMLVIQADKEVVDETILDYKKGFPSFWVDYAALNSSTQTVVAGDSTFIAEFAKYCKEKSLKTTILAASHAFHSRHMEPMLETYCKVAETVKTHKIGKDASIYISGMEGKIISLDSINADYWVRHTREPVKYMDACKVAKSEGCSLFLEIGPHPVLSALTMMNTEGLSVTCLPSIRRKEGEWVTLLDSLAKLYLSDWKGAINWKGFDRYYKRSRVSIPFYPFNRRPIWKALEAELPIVHPLLGKVIPTDCDHSIFESRLTLKNTSFIQDHVIGNTIIFPGAAFLEMCLAGGYLTVQNGVTSSGVFKMPQKPIVLQSLRISKPLAFYDSKLCRLQISSKLDVNEKDVICYNVRVARHIPSVSGGAGEWILHATAMFFPVPATFISVQDVDIPSIQNSWERVDIAGFYEKVPQTGLHLGPKFQSLETGWKSEKGILFSVKIQEDGIENYLIHPIIADAMIQATMLWTTRDKLNIKLQVPVQIGKFSWFQSSTSACRYIYCTTSENDETDCVLLDGDGNRLAQISDIDFMETSAKMVEGMIQQQTTSMPKIWKEVWKGTPESYDLTTIGNLPLLQINDRLKRFLDDANNIEETEICFNNSLRSLAYSYFLNAMYELGWNPAQRIPFSLEDLTKLLPRPKEHFKKYVKFFLQLIVGTGMIETNPEQVNKYYFDASPPTQDDVNKDLQKILRKEDSSRVDYKMVVEIGRNLPQILLGKVNALQILFPENNKINAYIYYKMMWNRLQPAFSRLNDELIIPMLNEYHAVHLKTIKARARSPVLRILEVGAGTGTFTEDFLATMETWGKPIEFYFTDVSASFFNGAEKKFEKYSQSMIFKKFNIEEDALAQGFCPKYFDMIVAYEVLHVAKDLRKTLRNLKCLLKPGGIFQIIETTIQDPLITQIFGLLEGYWQFEDLDLRPNHAILTPEKWKQVLGEINCDKIICTPMYNNIRSFIIARLSAQEQYNDLSIPPLEKPLHSWLIFYHDSNAYLAELLRGKLNGVNRKVYTVKRPSTCSEREMKELIKSNFCLALEDVENLEGIVYLWGFLNHITNRDQSQISLPLINLVQEVTECASLPRLYVVTQGTACVRGTQVTNPTSGTLHGIIKSLTNENISMHLNCLDLCPDEPVVNQVGNIFQDLWYKDQPSGVIAYRDHTRLFCKLARAKVTNNEPLPLPSGSTRFQLQLPNTRLISDLEFGVLQNYTLEENEVEVKVMATALNFRDVFTVLKPIKQFEELNSIGMDFAGVITKLGSNVANWKAGDRIIGRNLENNISLPSHVKIEESLLMSIPLTLTFAEGATLPTVFLTVYHSLIKLAKMKRGDNVLIHTASGGVGLCAIQLAKNIGAEVIATAGSKRKQNYLRNIGIKHVFHSRTTEFGQQILELTKGRGVDIILNSLTGNGFKEASLSALANNGKFIEMSTLNVWSPEEVKKMRPDVLYEIMNLLSLDRANILELLKSLKEFLYSGNIRPIPFVRFDAVNIRGALNHLQNAKHIGKIVCVMPEVKIENSKITTTTPLCNEFSTYLVTGGLGGIGFELVKWMLNNGAKHIAIASRGNPTAEIALQIQSWNRQGIHVETFQVDIGDHNQCHLLFQKINLPDRGFPPLRGIMHVAGVLADATLKNQNWSKYRLAYNPKVDGTWNLHDLSKDLLLEHFVVFSSMAVTIGTPGQSNHSAANNFEDSLVAYRRSNGLPATSINWGNWGEIGVATDVDIPGINPITTSQGMQALETFLKTQMSHLAVINVESFGLLKTVLPRIKSFVEDQSLFDGGEAGVLINSDEFWKDVDNAEDRQGKLLPFKKLIKSTLKNMLKMEHHEEINDFMDFHTIGIDSLMVLELKNGLQNVLGSRISPTASQLKDSNNTEELANQLVNILDGEGDLNSATYNPTMKELQELIREDSILPENVRLSEGMLPINVSEIRNVLLTGATGTFGPYILRDLSHRPNIKKIYCLIRKSKLASPMERLLKRLQNSQLGDQVDLSKVECIQGDIIEDKFGLSEEGYNHLANGVDAIFHSAVRMDYIAKYCRATEKTKLDIRTVNLKGTIHILEFAVHAKLKQVYHASTILTLRTANDEGYALEDWQDVGAFDQCSYNWGYPISKHICEQLVGQAVERGIPCKVFRLPLIGGDSKTGKLDYVSNHFVLRWLTYLKLNCMPDAPIPMVYMSVDHCAQISLDMFFNPGAPLGVYHIAQRDTGKDVSIVTIAEEFGIRVKLVSLKEFVDKLKSIDNSPLLPFLSIYEEEGIASTIYEEYKNPTLNFFKKCLENSSTFFGSRKLSEYLQNYDALASTEAVMRRDMRFLKESGVFDKFGITCKF